MRKFFPVLAVIVFLLAVSFLACSQKKEPVPEKKDLSSAADSMQVEPEESPAVSAPVQPAVSNFAADTAALTAEGEWVIADFNSGTKPNNLNGDFGTWNKDPQDNTQGCAMSFEDDDAAGASGYSMRLDYDVDSPNPAYNGFWMKLDGLDASAFNTLSIYLRGDGYKNFTKRIKFEIKDSSGKISPYIVNGITDKWQKFEIPFERFRKIHDWKSMSEFVVVFDDINSDPKQGTVLIDQITLKKK